MDEKKETNKVKEEGKDKPASDDTGDGIQSKAISDLDRANDTNERYARESDRREEILKREEALEVSRRVGGTTEAGTSEVKKEETNQEYVDKLRANGWRADG